MYMQVVTGCFVIDQETTRSPHHSNTLNHSDEFKEQTSDIITITEF